MILDVFAQPGRDLLDVAMAGIENQVSHFSVKRVALPRHSLQHLIATPDRLPPTLLLQAFDDPWVPAASAQALQAALPEGSPIRQTFTPRGGHNGFHGRGGCWGDQLAVRWLQSIAER